MTNELKPCPFCGGEAKLHGESFFVVICNNDLCSASTNVTNTRTETIKVWNTRQPAFDWKPIEELTDNIILAGEQILLYGKSPNWWREEIRVCKLYGDQTNRPVHVGIHGICGISELPSLKEAFTHYTLLTPPNEE